MDTPKKLYRFYKKEGYADDLVNGNIRLGWQKFYKTMEDKNDDDRPDSTEGDGTFFFLVPDQEILKIDINRNVVVGRTTGPGIMHCTSQSINENYLLCVSNPVDDDDINHMRNRFSDKSSIKLPSYNVITDTDKFREKISFAFKNSSYSDVIISDSWRWIEVDYTKDEGRDPNESIDNKIDLHLSLKHKKFAWQKEWRLAATINGDSTITPEQISLMQVQGEERTLKINNYLVSRGFNDMVQYEEDRKRLVEKLDYYIQRILWQDYICALCAYCTEGLKDCVEVCS